MEEAGGSRKKRSGVQPRGSSLCDLDDDLVAKVLMFLDPYPSVANVALTSHRLRRLATDKGRWLLVGGAPPAAGAAATPQPGRGPSGPSFPTIAAAVAASRPGDTIWLAPGAPHAARAVRVRWPLRICGGGADCTAVVSPPGEAAFDVGASAQIMGLSIDSRLGPCILHRRGTLRVELCTLLCHNGGLDHLVAPIVTAAVSGPPLAALVEAGTGPSLATAAAAAAAAVAAASGAAAGPRRAAAVAAVERERQNAAATGALSAEPADAGVAAHTSSGGGDAPGPGRLAVEDTRLEGSSGAGVLCVGTGALRAVRCVRTSHTSWYFLEVDSRHPGRLPPGGRPLCEAAAGDAVAAPETGAAAACGDELLQCEEASLGPGGCPSWRFGNWQQRQQRQQQQQQQQEEEEEVAGLAAGGCGEAAPMREQQQQQLEDARRRGLERINLVLGPLAISPAMLAAHLAARIAAVPPGAAPSGP